MKSLPNKTLLSIAVAALVPFTAYSAPLDPSERDMASQFSVDMQRAFNIYADSDHRDLVWYVPKVGQIALTGVNTGNPRPRFSVYSRAPWTGFLAGQDLVHFGGAFDTTGGIGDLRQLEREAQAKGLRVSPATAAKATTKFLLTDLVVGNNGRIDTECHTETWTGPNGEVQIPVCTALNNDGERVSTDFMYKFRATTPRGSSSVSQNIPFQGVTMPEWVFPIQDLMETGSNWDANFQAVTEWELTTLRKTRVARININWSRTFEQASTYFGIHNNACVDIEVQTFFRRLLDNQNGESGITVEYLHDDGTYKPEPINDEQFDNVVDAVYQEMRNELFNEMRDYGQSQLGRVDTEATAMFTLRANYEKLIFKRNETRYVSWNPGSSVHNASTNMTVQCVLGGFGTSVTWDVDSEACRQLAGME
ncbi:hypothetical protein [Algicola sagamiensis]|uniref:hypothetical protein n=1 Tax=Algicola sagamiensis TaxID=163869 RepID=UPI000368729E|nr:hypothetical protein [Algicola sagamiensis]